MKDEEDEATKKVNASKNTDVETGSEGSQTSEEENPDATKEEGTEIPEVESKPSEPGKEEITSDYLEEGKEEEEEIDYKKRYGDSTREFQAFKAKNDELSRAVTNLGKLAELNPRIIDEIEAAREKMSGATEAPDNSTLIREQVDKALEPIKRVAQDLEDKERLEKVKVLAEFERKTPDLFSLKATREEKKAIRLRIGKVAGALVETGMEFSEAVNRAYLVVNPKAVMQKGKDEAYKERVEEEQAGFANQVSSEGKETKKTQYSKRELEIADKLDSTGKVKKAMLSE